MGRSCCVQGCKSGKIVPSHGIPVNEERRKQWLQILKLNITDEAVIKQLRVCHKHFRNNDYSCSPNYRRLLNTAVPCMELEYSEVGAQQEVSQQHTSEIGRLARKQELLEDKMEVLHHQQEETIQILFEEQKEKMVLQQQQEEKIEMLHQQQEEKIEMLHQQQEEKIEMLCQQQEEKIEMLFQRQREMEKQLIKNNQQTSSARRRPNLLGITRKNILNSQAQLFYQKLIKSQKNQRRLKQKVQKLKKKHTSNKITLSTTDHRGRKDKTALVRQQILDMMMRNDEMASQVYE